MAYEGELLVLLFAFEEVNKMCDSDASKTFEFLFVFGTGVCVWVCETNDPGFGVMLIFFLGDGALVVVSFAAPRVVYVAVV